MKGLYHSCIVCDDAYGECDDDSCTAPVEVICYSCLEKACTDFLP